MSVYTIKFYKGKRLILEHVFERDSEDDFESFKTGTAQDAAQMIEESIACNEDQG